MERTEVVIVGAGPAGLQAAITLAQHDMEALVVDEQPAPGGQIYRQPPGSFKPASGAAEPAGHELLRRAGLARGVRWQHTTTAWGIFGLRATPDSYADGDDGALPSDGPVLALAGPGPLRRVAARRVLLAPGAYDLPVAFPGWTLPGVMAAGGVQAFLKSQQLLPGRRFVLAGAHPLLLVIADQLVARGAQVVEVALAQPRPTLGQALGAATRLRGDIRRLREAVGPASRLRRARVRLRFSTLVIGAQGEDGVEAVRLAEVDENWRPRPGSERLLSCDTLALGYGFAASSELARQAGCVTSWRPAAGGWVVLHDDWMRSSQESIYVAGEITGIAGADQAAAEGRLAALGILRDLGRLDADAAAALAAPVRRRLTRLRRFTALVQDRFAARHAVLAALADDETLVCRCEEVSAAALRTALDQHPHLGTADAVKLLTRVGMGPCQGRFCGFNVVHEIAVRRGVSIDEIGPFAARPPVKPLPLAKLAEASHCCAAGPVNADAT